MATCLSCSNSITKAKIIREKSNATSKTLNNAKEALLGNKGYKKVAKLK